MINSVSKGASFPPAPKQNSQVIGDVTSVGVSKWVKTENMLKQKQVNNCNFKSYFYLTMSTFLHFQMTF